MKNAVALRFIEQLLMHNTCVHIDTAIFRIQIPSHQILTACARIRNERSPTTHTYTHTHRFSSIISIIIVRIHICMMIRLILAALYRMRNNDTHTHTQPESYVNKSDFSFKPFEFYWIVGISIIYYSALAEISRKCHIFFLAR